MEENPHTPDNKRLDSTFVTKNQTSGSTGGGNGHDQTELIKDPKWDKEKLEKDQKNNDKQIEILKKARSMDDRGDDEETNE